MKKLRMRNNNTRGLLFTFCGLDGCGKTTMMNRLLEDLKREYDVTITKQPTNNVRESEIFRTYMDSKDHDAFDYRSLSLLAASDKERHFLHDGMICGYNQENKTYCIYSYDSSWVYQKFWTPQKCFDRARISAFKDGKYGDVCGIKPSGGIVNPTPEISVNKLKEYLDSNFDKYPEDGEGKVFGIVVHNYIAKYVGKLHDGSIPYERMDRRIFRLIWEHKKVMLEKIFTIEKVIRLPHDISEKYEQIVAKADMIRMLYASHHKKRRDSVLPVIQKKLIEIKDEEELLLKELIVRAERVKKSGTVEYYKE